MYRVEFYETEDGDSQIWDFLEDLRLKQLSARMPVSSINKQVCT